MAYRSTQDAAENERAACVLVLGAHRSGTSALTRILNIHGCSLPATLMGPGIGNERGHWESEAIAAFNDELLASAGTSWDDWQALNVNWYRSPVVKHFAKRARELLRHEFDDRPFFVLKDPRICRIAPFWLDALAGAGFDPLIVLPVRNPTEVAASLHRRDATNEWTGRLLWLRHVLDAEMATRGCRRVFVSYSQLLNNWRGVVSRVGEHFDLTFPRQTAASDSEADQFIDRKAIDNIAESLTLRDRGQSEFDILVWSSETFTILHRWSESSEELTDHSALDRIRVRFDQATSALGPAFSTAANRGSPGEGERTRRDLEVTREQLAETETKLQAVEERAGALDLSNAELSDRNAALEHHLHVMKEENTRQNSMLEEARHQLDVAERGAARARWLEDELHGKEVALAEAIQQCHTLLKELDTLKTDGRRLADLLTEAERFKAGAEAERIERFRELAKLSELFLDKERVLDRAAELGDWLRRMNLFLIERPTWWSWLPVKQRLRLERRAMQRKRLFNAQAYLTSYPDVAAHGNDPVLHYMRHGIDEGRRPFAD